MKNQVRVLGCILMSAILFSSTEAAPPTAPTTRPSKTPAKRDAFLVNHFNLDLTNAGPDVAYQAVAEAAGVKLDVFDSTMWNRPPLSKVKFDIHQKDVTYWEAMIPIMKKAPIWLQIQPTRMCIIPDTEKFSNPPMVAAGPLMVSLDGISIEWNAYTLGMPKQPDPMGRIRLQTWSEPGARIINYQDFAIEALSDEQGPLTGTCSNSTTWSAPNHHFDLQFQAPRVGMQKIKQIKAKLTVLAASDTKQLEIADPLKAEGALKQMGTFSVNYTKPQYDGKVGTVTYTVITNEEYDFPASMPPWMLRVEDAEGNPYWIIEMGQGVKNGRSISYTVQFKTSDEVRTVSDGIEVRYHKAGPPAKMIFEVPTAVRKIRLPIEFNDIAIPNTKKDTRPLTP